VTWNVNVALSDGWSFDGNHERAPSGSLITYDPSGVRIHPTGTPKVAIVLSPGTPW
jgi:hypothetical protein